MKASAPSPALDNASARAWTSETTCTRMSRTVEQRLEDAAPDEGDQDDQHRHDASGSEGEGMVSLGRNGRPQCEQALSAIGTSAPQPRQGQPLGSAPATGGALDTGASRIGSSARTGETGAGAAAGTAAGTTAETGSGTRRTA